MYDLGTATNTWRFPFFVVSLVYMEFKDVENAQQAYRKKVGIIVVVSIAITITLLVTLVSSAKQNSMLDVFYSMWIVGTILGFFAFILILLIASKEHKVYQSAYKAYFVEKSLREVFTNLQYNHEVGLNRSKLLDTNMINLGDSYDSNDLTTGKYNDVGFTQADVCIKEKHRSGDSETYVTLFKGRFMIFEFPKTFAFRLEVIEKGFGSVCRIPSQIPQTGRKFENIQLESNEFNEVFRTYAEDGFEAFYILDPAFINGILDLNDKYNGKLFLGFTDSRLIVGLNDRKDVFEPPSVLKKLDEENETKKTLESIHLITDFIDKLKLNKKLFK